MKTTLHKFKHNIPLHLMVIPGLVFAAVFSYAPLMGLVLAFQKFNPVRFGQSGFFASTFVGWDNFRYVLRMPEFSQVMFNTIYIASMKIATGLIVPLILALMLNEVRQIWFKRSVQTITYIPHFFSWVILGGILTEVLSLDGIFNQALGFFGIDPVFFFGHNTVFPFVLVGSELWKNMGYATIIYLAALTTIDPHLYEAASVEGAGRMRQTWHITLPGIAPIIVLLGCLSLGSILNAGFEQVFILINPVVFESGDIIDTLNYRIGITNARYDIGTAIGMFKSVISLIMVAMAQFLAFKYANYRIF